MTDEAASIKRSIAALQAQRDVLGPAVVEPALKALQQQLDALQVASVAAANENAERKIVTVMFADISGFTALSEALDAEEVRTIINDCFADLVPCIERYDGVVDKFIGDAVMALFGAPIAHEDDPRRALLAALEMRACLDAFNARHGLSLGIHFGINTGEVVAGGVGSASRQDYSVMGDAVNVAARLEDASQTGEILVGPETHLQTAAEFEFEQKPRMRLKGKSEDLPIYALVRRRSQTDRKRLATSILVGRDQEVARPQHAIDLLQGGRGSGILIGGPAGIGKSRLLAETLNSAGSEIRTLLLVCQPHGEALGFGLLRQLARHLVWAEPNPDPELLEKTLQESCLAAGPIEEAEDALVFLKLVAGLSVGDGQLRVLQSLPDEVFEARMADALAFLIKAQVAVQPLLLGIEDLHWADSSSLRLLARVAERKLPQVLLIATTRPGGDADQVFKEVCERLELAPLNDLKSRSMLANLLGGQDAEIIEAVVERAEGNPFFLEEFAAIIGEQDQSLAPLEVSLDIPSSIRSLMGARLDRLPQEAKLLLQVASVVGRSFTEQSVGQLVNLARRWESLTELVAQDVVHIQSQAQDTWDYVHYAFRHALTHDAAYRSLLVKRRRELHQKLAQILIEASPPQENVSAALIAHHLEYGADYHLAGMYLLRAAQEALETFANREAIAFFSRVLTLPYHDAAAARTLLLEAHRGLGEMLERTGRFAESEAQLEEALGLVEPSDHLTKAGLLRQIGQTWNARRQPSKALALFGEAADVLAGSPEQAQPYWQEWCELQLDRLWSLYWAQEIDEMRRLVASSTFGFEAHGTLAQRSRFQHRQLLIRFRDEGSNISDATLALAREGLRNAERLDDPVWLSQASFAMGLTLLWRDCHLECRHWLGRSLEIARKIGNAEYEVLALTYLTVSLRLEGKQSEVKDLCAQSKERATVSGMEVYVGVSLANQAWVALREGRDSVARELAVAALSKWDSIPWPLGWFATGPLFELAVKERDRAGALALARGMLVPGQHSPGAEFAKAIRGLVDQYDKAGCRDNIEAFHRALLLARRAGVA